MPKHKSHQLDGALLPENEEFEPDETAGSMQDRHFVTALARGLEVLSCFRSGASFLGNYEIADRCGLPRSTITRLTYTLTRLGYLHLVPETGKYRLGTATAALGSAMLANLDVRQVARPYMQLLAEETDSVVALATRDRLSMLYLECCRSASILTLSLNVGSRIPLGTTASGRAFLACVTQNDRADLMERLQELGDANWLVIQEGILQSVKEYNNTGCVVSAGAWVRDVHGIAGAFLPGRGLPAMTISVAGAAGRFPIARLRDEIRPKLLETLQSIESGLGQRPVDASLRGALAAAHQHS